MQILNSQYREIHETTDVLAFPDIYRIKPNKISNNFAENTFLGDIVISTDEVLRLSIEESKDLDELIDELYTIIKENNIKGIIIGNPINMDGSEGYSSQSIKDD